jgi:hypothetical protein
MDKIEEFIKRNRKRNAHLYESGLVAGYDYVVCPYSKERMSMIKTNYITKVLGMKIEDYPDMQRICSRRLDNIKRGLSELDAKTGLTKHQLSVRKSQKKLNKIDPKTGMTYHKLRTQKTRSTHMSKIDEFGRNGYSQLASKAIINGNITKAKRGLILDASLRTEYYRFKIIVTYLTNRYRKKISEGYTLGLCGVENAHQIDHKFSIMHGYKQKVSPCVLGHLANLQIKPWKDNLSKHSRSDISLDEILRKTGYTKEQSELEYEFIMNHIREDIRLNRQPTGAYIIGKLNAANLL